MSGGTQMKKQLLILVMVTFASTAAFAQGWVKSYGSKQGNTEITGVVTDGENQAIIAGTFSSEELNLDASNTLINNGITDVFLLKYDTAGNLVW